MRRRAILIVALLLYLLTVSGCSENEEIPVETTQQTHETVMVEEDVFYFCNELEYSRLYSQRLDGTDLKLVLDMECYNVCQYQDKVYFQNGADVLCYHIPSGTVETCISDALFYEIDGENMVYTVDNKDKEFYVDIHYRNLTTGEDRNVAVVNMTNFVIGSDVIYYTNYEENDVNMYLFAYDIAADETILLSDEYGYYYSLLPQKDGLMFRADSEEGDIWYYTDAKGTVWEEMKDMQLDAAGLIHSSRSGLLYLDWNYSDEPHGSIRLIRPDGHDILVYESPENKDLYVNALGNERFLVSQSEYVGWGEKNEDGYYDHYANQLQYMMLHPNGALVPLDATGEIGRLFADGDFPILDSSTARIPVTEALYNLFVGNYDYAGPVPLCSTTHGAWINMADRKVDLAFLAAPTDEEQAYLNRQNVEVEMKLYGGDGLVFIGNAGNPVEDLTHEQIIAIYRGEITNWSEVGGPDQPISVYYRDDQSGSQRLFESLVFKGLEIPEFESMGFSIMDDMLSIVDMVAYDPYSIGYSIMTYLEDVHSSESLKVFSVNDAAPCMETIRDGSYPYSTRGYIVIRSDEPEDSPARRLFDWFGCPVSDDLLTNNGVTPLHEE